MNVISNTTVISNFAAIDALDRLRELYGELFLSTEVYKEIQRGLEEGYSFYGGIEESLYPLSKTGWLHLTSLSNDPEIDIFSSMPGHLHAGEASSLAIAQHRSWLFLTDDKAARLWAKTQDVKFSGTLGCLILGVEQSLWTLEQANDWLGKIIEVGFHSPFSDLSTLVRRP